MGNLIDTDDPGASIVALRVEQLIADAAAPALQSGEPGADRVAVAAVLRCLADLVATGSLRGFNTEWHTYEPGEAPTIVVWFTSRRRAGEVVIPLSLAKVTR